MTDYTKIIEGLVPKLDGESAVRHRTALVDVVNADGTVDLDFDGTIVPDVSVLQGAAVVAGGTVQVAAWAGDLLVLGMTAAYQTSYQFGGTAYFTSSGAFAKATYPGLRAVQAKAQAGGGAGGGAAATAAGQGSAGSGGGGGGYTEEFILASALAASETVTVGAGGAGASGATGGAGGASSFGTFIVAEPGAGGFVAGASAANGLAAGASGGGVTTAGDLNMKGGGGSPAIRTSTTSIGGNGGSAPIGGGGGLGLGTSNGSTGGAYGGGGGGASNGPSQGAARTGGDGAAGVVIVDLYF